MGKSKIEGVPTPMAEVQNRLLRALFAYVQLTPTAIALNLYISRRDPFCRCGPS